MLYNGEYTIKNEEGKHRTFKIRTQKEDARFVLPNACVSEIVVSSNFREWRHIFAVRTSKKAQWEIRKACTMMLEILKNKASICFSDIQPEL